MSYVEQTWQTGDTVTAEKLNHMEAGITGAGGVLKATYSNSNNTLDVTWQDIYNAGFAVFYKSDYPGDSYILYTTRIMNSEGEYYVGFSNPEMGGLMYFYSDSATGLLTLAE